MSCVEVSLMLPTTTGHPFAPSTKPSVGAPSKPHLVRLSLVLPNNMPYKPGTQRQGPPSALQLSNLATSGALSSCSSSSTLSSSSGSYGRSMSRRRSSNSIRSQSLAPQTDIPNVSEIIPGKLYISDLSFAENPVYLAKYGITHILSTIQDSVSLPSPSVLNRQIKHKQIHVADFPFAELISFFPDTWTFISTALSSSNEENKENKVLVHCHEGISRSTTVVAAYLMQKYGMSPQEALDFVKSRRKAADPNIGFIQQLNEHALKLGQKPRPKATAASSLRPPTPSSR